jgi:hypothetical protein
MLSSSQYARSGTDECFLGQGKILLHALLEFHKNDDGDVRYVGNDDVDTLLQGIYAKKLRDRKADLAKSVNKASKAKREAAERQALVGLAFLALCAS